MEKVNDINEFIQAGYMGDITKIINSKFSNFLVDNDATEIESAFYVKMIENKMIEKFDENRGVKFSTFIYKCLHNFILGYYSNKSLNKKSNQECLSLDFVINEETSMHNFIASEQEDKDLKIDRRVILDRLKKYDKGGKVSALEIYELTLEGYTDPEIASIKNITASYVGVIKKNIRDIIRRDFE